MKFHIVTRREIGAMNELKRRLPTAGNLLRGTRVIAACRGANPEDLSALFARTRSIQALLSQEAWTIDEVCEHPTLTDEEKRIAMDHSGVRIKNWGCEVKRIFVIVERLN